MKILKMTSRTEPARHPRAIAAYHEELEGPADQPATYGIAATDGALLADGLGDKGAARDVAQMAANMRGERVWLYREGDPSPATPIDPQSQATLGALAAMRVKYGPSAVLPRTGIRCPRCCALQHERGVCAHEFHGPVAS